MQNMILFRAVFLHYEIRQFNVVSYNYIFT
nr:MAG TPA: hypothetical protein [Caudoviricetes sp.]